MTPGTTTRTRSATKSVAKPASKSAVKKDPSRALAVCAADLAADGKALDITVLELREISSVADYFVLASGRSHIQVEAVCVRIVEGVRERLGERPISVEGLENSQWAVLDFGSVVIHVFQEDVRKLYDLERLWSLAPKWKHGEEPSPAPSERKKAQGGDAGEQAAPAARTKTAPARSRKTAASDSSDPAGTTGSPRIASRKRLAH